MKPKPLKGKLFEEEWVGSIPEGYFFYSDVKAGVEWFREHKRFFVHDFKEDRMFDELLNEAFGDVVDNE